MKSVESATKLAQVALTSNPFQWHNFPAPEPSDLIWNSFSITTKKRFLRRLAVYAISVLLIFFWAIPIGFVASLSNLTTLSKISFLQFLVHLIDLSPALQGWLEGILPSLALIIFMAFLITIITRLVSFEKPISYSERARNVFIVFFFFQIVHVFLGTMIAGTFFGLVDELQQIIAHPLSIIDMLASTLPLQSNFYINYIMLQSLTGNFLALWRPVDVAIYLIKLKFFTKTSKDKKELTEPQSFSYEENYAIQLLYFTIIQCYSTISPLILPFGILSCVFVLISTGTFIVD